MVADGCRNGHNNDAQLLGLISVKRLLVTLSDEAVVIWQAYQVRNKIRNRDDALDQLIREFGGLAPAPKE